MMPRFPNSAALPVLIARLDALDDMLRVISEGIRKMRHEIRELDPVQFPPPVPLGPPTHDLRVYPSDLQRTPLQSEQTDPPDSRWIPIIHRMTRTDAAFPRPCMLPGLYLTEPPRENRKASFEVMRILPQGEQHWRSPTLMDIPMCSSCGAVIDPFSNADLDYLSVMQPATVKSGKRGRKRSEEETPVGGSPALPRVDPPSIFPGHTNEADRETLTTLHTLAQDLGLPEPPGYELSP